MTNKKRIAAIIAVDQYFKNINETNRNISWDDNRNVGWMNQPRKTWTKS